jgi:pantothenate synthetase
MAPASKAAPGTALAAAVRIGNTRLIDNVLVP